MGQEAERGRELGQTFVHWVPMFFAAVAVSFYIPRYCFQQEYCAGIILFSKVLYLGDFQGQLIDSREKSIFFGGTFFNFFWQKIVRLLKAGMDVDRRRRPRFHPSGQSGRYQGHGGGKGGAGERIKYTKIYMSKS